MLLRGATAQDFLAASGAPEGEPFFAEFLGTEGAVPRARAQGVNQSRFTAEVRALVNLHLTAKGLPQHFEVRITLDVATGRVVLDTPRLDRGVRDGNSPPGPQVGPIGTVVRSSTEDIDVHLPHYHPGSSADGLAARKVAWLNPKQC
jgi:hypothetical protein